MMFDKKNMENNHSRRNQQIVGSPTSSESSIDSNEFRIRRSRSLLGINVVPRWLRFGRTPSTSSGLGIVEDSENTVEAPTVDSNDGIVKVRSESCVQQVNDTSKGGTRSDGGSNTFCQVAVYQCYSKKDQDRYDIRAGKDVTGSHIAYGSVFDGHGVNSLAADICVRKLYNEVMTLMQGGDDEKNWNIFDDSFDESDKDHVGVLPTADVLTQAFRNIHDFVLAKSVKEPRTGSCAAVAFMKQDEDKTIRGRVAWVGDSSAFLVKASGAIQLVTRYHRIDDNPEELERFNNTPHPVREDILETDFWKNTIKTSTGLPRAHSFIARRQLPGGDYAGVNCIFPYTGGVSLQISRSLGDSVAARSIIPDPDVTDFAVPPDEVGTILVLCSDGISDALSFEDIGKFLSKEKDLHKACKKLALRAQKKRLYQGQSPDDITLILIRLGASTNR